MTPSSEKPKSPARRFAPLVVALAVFVTAMVLGPQAKVQRQLNADFTLSAAGSPYAGEALNRCKDELRRALGRAMPDAAGDMQIETGESPQPHTARVGLKINDVGTSADARQVIAKLEALPGERVYLFERQVEAADTSLEKERQTALDQLRRTTALIDAFWKKHLAEDESAAGKDPPVVVEKEKDPPREEPALHPDWIQVRQRLTKLEQRLTKITKTHTASHPELIQLQEKVAAVRTELHDTPKFAEKRRGPTIELQPPGQSIATPKPKEDVGETKDRREKRLADYRRLKAEQAAAQEAVRRATAAAGRKRTVTRQEKVAVNVELAAAPVVQTWTAPLSSTYVGLMGLISVIVGALFWWRAIKRPALLRVQTADEVQTASGAPLVGLLSTGRPPSPTWGRASRAALGISHAALAAGLLLALLLVASGDDYARLLASDPYTALSGSLWRVFGGAG